MSLRNNWLQAGVRRLFLPPGAVRRVRFGPRRGMVFRVSQGTGLAPWYSGAERERRHAFRGRVRPGGAADMGANWGIHSLYLSRLEGRER